MSKWDARRAQLESELKEIDARLVEIDTALDEPVPKNDEDRASMREDDEVLEGVARTGQHEKRMIRAALDRIKSGEYGICATCGEDIAKKRLDLLPYTPFCQECAPQGKPE